MTPGGSAVVRQARRRLSRHGVMALGAMLVPAVLFPLGLFLLRDDPRFAWLGDVRAYPWELWAIAVSGTAATLGGVLDWRFHRGGETVVGRPEHRAHLLALGGGGVPLFALMAAASISPRPARFLVPVLVVLIYTVVMICYTAGSACWQRDGDGSTPLPGSTAGTACASRREGR